MTVSQSRGATKSFGSKVVRFRVPGHSRRYTVHEDLICRTSAYFKSRFHKHRKPISGSCPICFDDLDPKTKDITFCEKCGQNIHEDCIEQWKRTNRGRPSNRNPSSTHTCPMCREKWRIQPADSTNVQLEQSLDAEAVQVYLDWLYSGTIRIPTTVSWYLDSSNLVMLKCWEVSTALEDTTFKNAVICTYLTKKKAMFRVASMEFVFGEEKRCHEMEDFVVDVFMARLKPGWFERESDKWPKRFVRVLADKSLEKALAGGLDVVDLKAKYLGAMEDGRNGEVEEVEVVDSTTEDDSDGDSSSEGNSSSEDEEAEVVDRTTEDDSDDSVSSED